jgi:hypothetical protein
VRASAADTYVLLAKRFNWTQQQVDATDPDLIDELLAFCRAEADHRRIQAKEREMKRRG